ncbi:hypothetical protein SAMN02745127_01020 [Oceanospirillum multiglobuliferum]|uniref:DUF4139 domain-containing protein n=1 Tax=Oceanospirillum multiglobuliferum TaxID=64969 RepID=A0A1T4N6B6_9GAMM|nr:hypothetical protein [Oceanospirillum multiglobuliferum]OPX55853.1 hypothetical protein BTE48_06545 [Oceanospirillum multiglobuliferum]SJZ74762.1 hypothetical protein SAMN02745127_01020 [Oceanospirillum multiglobuliferum]
MFKLKAGFKPKAGLKNNAGLVFALLMPFGNAALADISTPEQRSQLNVTLYQNGMALIQDSRTLALEAGIQTIRFQGVTPEIIADSALLVGNDLKVLERNYSFDLISLDALLKASIGKNLTLQLNGRYFGNQAGPYFVSAQLLAVQGQRMILKAQIPGEAQSKIIALPLNEYADLISFDEMPENLSESPTLSMDVQTSHAANVPTTLTYLSTGFDWQASYVADITSDNSINLAAWVSLDNNTTTPLNQARMQLLAGQVNRVTPVYKHQPQAMRMSDVMAAGVAEQENLGDYKLFTLPQPVDLAAKQKKQVSLFNAERVRVEKHYSLPVDLTYSFKRRKAEISLKLNNTQEAGLGMAMPAGIMRFYQTDHAGLRQFIGEVRVPDLDNREEYSANIGSAFGISSNNKTLRWDSAGWLQGELELINSQKKAVTAELLLQPISYGDKDQFRTTSLCETPANKNDSKLKLSLRPVTGAPKVLDVTEEGNGLCRVSVRLEADTRALFRYEYRAPAINSKK